MTRITLFRSRSHAIGFEAEGHTGYAEEGSDIVCAAISALLWTLLMGWERLEKEKRGAIAARVMNPGQADLRFYARDGEERGAGDLFCAVEEGLRLIHQEYPGCVVIVPENEQKGETV